MEDGEQLSITRLMALLGLGPVVLLFACLTLKLGWQSLRVRTSWNRVEAKVSASTLPECLALEVAPQAVMVKRNEGYRDLAPGDHVMLFQNPKQMAQVRRTTFSELWLNTLLLGCFTVMFAGLGTFMFFQRPELAFEKGKAEFEAAMAQAQAQAKTGGVAPALSQSAVARADDGEPILLKEPAESWKANLFWGLCLGSLMCVPAIFAPEGVPAWKRWGMMAGGILWMTGMGLFAIRNFGRTVEWQGDHLLVCSPFSSRRIALNDVHRLERHDAREELRKMEQVGVSSYRTKPLDTRPSMIVYELKDCRGRTLLRLDKDMQPAEAMTKFLDRLRSMTEGR